MKIRIILIITSFTLITSMLFGQTSSGNNWTWGKQKSGMLGIGKYSGANQYPLATGYAIVYPEKMDSDTNWIFVSAGQTFCLGIKKDSTLWSWGAGFHGQLGTGSTSTSITPKKVGSDKWIYVSAGYRAAIGIKADGTLWSWGRNDVGQLGLGSITSYTTPQQVGTDTIWREVHLSLSDHTIALKNNGTLWGWGMNNKGQLGLGNTIRRTSPVQIGTDTTWLTATVGYNYSLAIKSDGSLWSWGLNSFGQLGLGNTTQKNSPTRVGTGNNWWKVSTKQSHVLALKTDSTLWVWGLNNLSRLGLGSSTTNQTSPTQLGTAKWKEISAGERHSLAVRSDGFLFSWGVNTYGQLGNGGVQHSNSPIQVGNMKNWTFIEAGMFTSFGIHKYSNSIPCKPLNHIPLSKSYNVYGCNELELKSKNSNYTSRIWSTGNTTSTLKVVSSGQYKLTEIDSRGCSNTDSVYVNLIKDVMSTSQDTSFCLVNPSSSLNIQINKWFRNTSNNYLYYSPSKTSAINASITFSNKSGQLNWKGFVAFKANSSLKCPIVGSVSYSVRYSRIVGENSDTIFSSGNKITPFVKDNSFNQFLWSNGDNTISANYSNSGKHWLKVTDSFGCTQTDTFHFSTLNLSLPVNVKGNLNDTVIIKVRDSSNTAASVTWENGNIGWNQPFAITTNKDTVHVSMSDAYRTINGSVVLTQIISASPSLEPQQNGLNQSNNTVETLVFPNPTNNVLHIQNTDGRVESYIIFDSLGRILMESTDKIVDVSRFSAGTYYIKLDKKVIKFIIQ